MSLNQNLLKMVETDFNTMIGEKLYELQVLIDLHKFVDWTELQTSLAEIDYYIDSSDADRQQQASEIWYNKKSAFCQILETAVFTARYNRNKKNKKIAWIVGGVLTVIASLCAINLLSQKIAEANLRAATDGFVSSNSAANSSVRTDEDTFTLKDGTKVKMSLKAQQVEYHNKVAIATVQELTVMTDRPTTLFLKLTHGKDSLDNFKVIQIKTDGANSPYALAVSNEVVSVQIVE